MKTLKEFVNILLDEAATSAADANKSGFGLMEFQSGPRKSVMLFDVKDAATRLAGVVKAGAETEEQWMDALEPAIVGFLQVVPPARGAAHGASVVKASAAREGYGPLMYDIAMTLYNVITPDRKSVSPSAGGIWKYYATRRNDVKQLPFDNVDGPSTPDTSDDAELHSGDDSNPLNAAYTGAKVDVSGLKMRAQKWLKWAEAAGLDATKASNALKYAGSGFFRQEFLHRGDND